MVYFLPYGPMSIHHFLYKGFKDFSDGIVSWVTFAQGLEAAFEQFYRGFLSSLLLEFIELLLDLLLGRHILETCEILWCFDCMDQGKILILVGSCHHFLLLIKFFLIII